jgi:aerobic-type carbon monoxide dehydrogenase small subunit (CoxS/CutS family)
MIMNSVSLLKSTPNPSSEQIIQATQGNICRRGTHSGIVEAVGAASKTMQKQPR